MQLRKCCNHPFLLNGVEEKLRLERKLTHEAAVMEALISCSGKLVLLDKLLPKLRRNGHRVL
jgi:chromodomain-helicase-DNA-binding protein 7